MSPVIAAIRAKMSIVLTEGSPRPSYTVARRRNTEGVIMLKYQLSCSGAFNNFKFMARMILLFSKRVKRTSSPSLLSVRS